MKMIKNDQRKKFWILLLTSVIMGAAISDNQENFSKESMSTSRRLATAEFSYLMQGRDWLILFPTCNGVRQSPIDIPVNSIQIGSQTDNSFILNLRTNLAQIVAEFTTHNVNTAGQFSQLILKEPAFPQVVVFNSTGFHVHAPGEHTINGVRGDAEVHILHQIDPNFANAYPFTFVVFAFIFKKSAGNPSNFWTNWNINKDQKSTSFNMTAALEMEMRSAGGYYRYSGSLTTPPCTQSVEFFIINKFFDISDAQLKVINDLFKDNPVFANGNGNNRELQLLNGRIIRSFNFDDLHKLGSGIVVSASHLPSFISAMVIFSFLLSRFN